MTINKYSYYLSQGSTQVNESIVLFYFISLIILFNLKLIKPSPRRLNYVKGNYSFTMFSIFIFLIFRIKTRQIPYGNSAWYGGL